jgi:hypothetical protein
MSRIVISDPNVYVGGFFFNVGGQARGHVAALNINTGLASSWDPDVFGGRELITLVANTVDLVGGSCRYRIHHG